MPAISSVDLLAPSTIKYEKFPYTTCFVTYIHLPLPPTHPLNFFFISNEIQFFDIFIPIDIMTKRNLKLFRKILSTLRNKQDLLPPVNFNDF